MPVKDLAPALRAFLLADSGISTAVGGTRIYPDEMQQGVTATSIVYQLISGRGDYHNHGPSGLASPRYQITAWAGTKDAARALSLLLKEHLEGYAGVMGSGDAAVTVHGVFLDAERGTKDDAAKLYGVQQDYIIHHRNR